MSVRICAKQLATATITHLRLVGGTAQTRRGRVVVNSPSYSQAEGIFRTYFGQECSRPLCFRSTHYPGRFQLLYPNAPTYFRAGYLANSTSVPHYDMVNLTNEFCEVPWP